MSNSNFHFVYLGFALVLSSCAPSHDTETHQPHENQLETKSLQARTPQLLKTKNLDNLYAFVEDSMDALLIPGAALAISQNGQIITERGFGVKALQGEPVTPHTRFLAASTTKGMTTLLLAKAVELGLADWDDPVIKHYPEFKIGDEEFTKSVLIRHLLCACTGLSRMDLDWTYTNDPDTSYRRVFEHLAQMQPNSALGKTFQYSNQLAAASGYVAGKIFYPDMDMGAAYDLAMQTYVFDPLGMDETTFDIQKALVGDIALPYAYNLKGDIAPVEQTKTRGYNHAMIAFRPTGGAWTNVHDMIKYVRNEITLGTNASGERLFSEVEMRKRHVPNVLAAPGRHYGMGLYIEDFSGIEVIRHSGSMRGYRSEVIIIPDAQVGAVIMSNGRNGYGLVRNFTRRLVEELYDFEPMAEANVAAAVKNHKETINRRQAELVFPVPDYVKPELAERYVSAKLGTLEVTEQQGSIYFDTGLWGMNMAVRLVDDQVTLVSTEPGIPHEFQLGRTDEGVSTLTIVSDKNQYSFIADQGQD